MENQFEYYKRKIINLLGVHRRIEFVDLLFDGLINGNNVQNLYYIVRDNPHIPLNRAVELANQYSGGSKNKKKSHIQSVIFDKSYFTLAQAKKLFKHMKLTLPKGKKVHSTKLYYRFRVKNPDYNNFYHRTKKLSDGIKAIIAFPKKK